MIASTQIISTKIFAFITVLVFKLSDHKVLVVNIKDKKSRLLFNKIANFTGKLLQNYK